MNMMLMVGLGLGLFAILHLLDIVRRKGAQFEYAAAMFIGELAVIFVLSQLLPSTALGVAIVGVFSLSLLITAAMWWRLFQRYQRQAGSAV